VEKFGMVRWINVSDSLIIRDIGILYAATGSRYRTEAFESASRCKSMMPNVPIAIFTESKLSHPSIDLLYETPNPFFDYMDKVKAISKTPFKQTLFLDTDTFVCANICSLFELLDQFDIAAAHASNRESTRSTYSISGVPAAFPEMNTGVLLYRKNRRTISVISNWHKLFKQDRQCYKEKSARNQMNPTCNELKPPGDQSSFREVLFKSNLRIATLPPEYNFRFSYTAFAGSEVRILHGRDRNLALIASIVNTHHKRRVYIPSFGVVQP
jgi:hypothetical protein